MTELLNTFIGFFKQKWVLEVKIFEPTKKGFEEIVTGAGDSYKHAVEAATHLY